MKKVRIKVFLKTSTKCTGTEITESAKIDVDGAEFEINNRVYYKDPYNNGDRMGHIIQMDNFEDEDILYIIVYVN